MGGIGSGGLTTCVRPFRGEGEGEGDTAGFDAGFAFESFGTPFAFAFGPAEFGGGLLLDGGRGDGRICSGRGVCVA